MPFSDRERLNNLMNTRAFNFLAAVEKVCDDDTIAKIEAIIFPEPSPEEKKEFIEQGIASLKRAGIDTSKLDTVNSELVSADRAIAASIEELK